MEVGPTPASGVSRYYPFAPKASGSSCILGMLSLLYARVAFTFQTKHFRGETQSSMGEVNATKRPLPTSSLIGICFGGLWAGAGSMAFSGSIRGVLLTLAVLLTAGLAVHASRSLAASESQSGMFHRRPYVVAVVLESLAIAGVVTLLPRYGAERYLLQALGVIVGSHFIGLWIASRSFRFVWISAGMCLVSIASIPAQHATAGVRAGDVLTGFGNALVLWLGVSLGIRAIPMRSGTISRIVWSNAAGPTLSTNGGFVVA